MHSLRRDLSYRKPVPQYVPTPPSSPFLDLPPPLPHDWREAIEHASSRNPSVTALPAFHDVPLADTMCTHTTAMRRKCSCSSDTIALAVRSAASRQPGSQRRSHLSYRPPTPPVQARCKRQRVDDEDTPLSDAHLIPVNTLYPHAFALDGSDSMRDPRFLTSVSTNSGLINALTTLDADRTALAEQAHSIHVSADANVSTTLLGCHSTCGSTLADDVKPKSSWTDLRVPPSYDPGCFERRSDPRMINVGTHSEDRKNIAGRLLNCNLQLTSRSLRILCCLSDG